MTAELAGKEPLESVLADPPGEPPVTGSDAVGDAGMGRRVAGNSFWLIGQPLLLNVLSIVSTGYIARKLGANDYGAFNLGFAQIALFNPLCHLGLRQVSIRAIAEERDRAEEVACSVLAVRLMLTALAAVAAFIWLSLPMYGMTTRIIGAAAVVSMVCSSLGSVAVDMFNGLERPRVAAQWQIVGGVVLTVLSVLALLAGLGLAGFVAAYVLGNALQLVLLLRAARQPFPALWPCWHRGSMKTLLLQARPFAVLAMLRCVTYIEAVDIMFLGALWGPAAVGPYSAAMGLMSRLLQVPEGIAGATYPAVASGYANHRREVEATVWRYMLNVVLLTAPVALCISFTAPTILWILFGKQYLSAATALRIGAWMLPLWGLNHMIRQSLAAVHEQDLVLKYSLFSGVLLFGLFALFIPRFGMAGTAAASIAREAIMLGLYLRPFCRHFRRPAQRLTLSRTGVALAVMLIPLGLMELHYGHVQAVLASGVAMAVYAAAALALRLVDVAALPLGRLRRLVGQG